jgi:hypothetical protein
MRLLSHRSFTAVVRCIRPLSCSRSPTSTAPCARRYNVYASSGRARSAALAREFADRHGVPADSREMVTNAIAMHHSPGVGLESGPDAYTPHRFAHPVAHGGEATHR